MLQELQTYRELDSERTRTTTSAASNSATWRLSFTRPWPWSNEANNLTKRGLEKDLELTAWEVAYLFLSLKALGSITLFAATNELPHTFEKAAEHVIQPSSRHWTISNIRHSSPSCWGLFQQMFSDCCNALQLLAPEVNWRLKKMQLAKPWSNKGWHVQPNQFRDGALPQRICIIRGSLCLQVGKVQLHFFLSRKSVNYCKCSVKCWIESQIH